MSQRSKVVHDFKSINLGQLQLQVKNAGNALSLTPAESNDIISLNSTSGSAISLPTPSAGLHYRFIVTNTGAHTITAPTACINGALVNSVFNTGANLATGAAKTSIATTAGSVIGDNLSLIATNNKYFLSGNVSNFNAVKFA